MIGAILFFGICEYVYRNEKEEHIRKSLGNIQSISQYVSACFYIVLSLMYSNLSIWIAYIAIVEFIFMTMMPLPRFTAAFHLKRREYEGMNVHVI